MSMTHDDVTRAARTMVDVEPPQDLEARIKRRLDREAQARPTITRWPIAVGLATAVATVIIVVALRSPEVPEFRRLEVPQSPGLPAVALAKAGPDVPKSAGPVVPSPIRLPSYRSMSEAEWDWVSRRVPALDVIDPIQPEAVSITPLTITPLMTAPMSGDIDEGRQ